MPDWFSNRTWALRKVDIQRDSLTGTVVIWMDESGLGEAWLENISDEVNVVRIYTQQVPRRRMEPSYVMDAMDAAALGSVFEEHVKDAPLYLVNLRSYSRRGVELFTADQLEDQYWKVAGFYAALGKALGRIESGVSIRYISVVSDVFGGDAVTFDPVAASALGFVQTMQQEYVQLRGRLVDLPLDHPAANAKRLSGELLSSDRESLTRWDGEQRWVNRYQTLDASLEPEQAAGFEEGGTYLVTGGLGGIGYELSMYLASRYDARLGGHHESEKRKPLAHLRATGADVQYIKQMLQIATPFFEGLNSVMETGVRI